MSTDDPAAGLDLKPSIGMVASVPVGDPIQRTWQRKWRDVQHERQSLADAYAEDHLEAFFKTCRELVDWIDESTRSHLAIDYLRKSPTLVVCDAIAPKSFRRG